VAGYDTQGLKSVPLNFYITAIESTRIQSRRHFASRPLQIPRDHFSRGDSPQLQKLFGQPERYRSQPHRLE